MIDPIHLRLYVIRPVIERLALKSDVGEYKLHVEQQLLGTICAESDCGRWLVQVGEGPAVSIVQMEPGMTGYEDCWKNYLLFREPLARKVLRFTSYQWPEYPPAREMIGNLNFAVAMARIKYLRDDAPIPSTLGEQAAYWKRVYNTPKGAGTVEKYVSKWSQFVSNALV